MLVTSTRSLRMAVWANTGAYANWLDGRANAHLTETWHVMVMDEHLRHFLDVAREVGVTVEEIDGAGDSETYRLLVGGPGTGWEPMR